MPVSACGTTLKVQPHSCAPRRIETHFNFLFFLACQVERAGFAFHYLKTQRGVKFCIKSDHLISCQCGSCQAALPPGTGPVAPLPARGLHIDDKAILNVSFKHTGEGSLNVLATDHFNIGGNIMLAAEVQHLLGFLNAAN